MPIIERILCATDLSARSRWTVGHALVMARRCRASVELLHVGHDAVDTRGTLGELTSLAAWACDQDVPTHPLLLAGPIAPTVLAEAAALGAGLIVMGTHAHRILRAALLGSATEEVVRKARCPVLTVPAAPEGADPEDLRAFARVLCAVDFSEPSLAALEHAVWMAESAGADLELLHVLPPPPPVAEGVLVGTVALTGSREALLERLPATMRDRCVVTIREGHPAQEILAAAHRSTAGVVVMGVHGRGALDRALFGSTTDQVLRRCACPVLTVRPVVTPVATGRIRESDAVPVA